MSERFRGYLPVVVDVETGGFDWHRHALLQIAAIPIAIDEAGELELGEDACPHLEPAPATATATKSIEVTGLVLDPPSRMAQPQREPLHHVCSPGRPTLR